MKYTKKNRYTNYRINKVLFSNHINELIRDIKSKVNSRAILTASPVVTKENKSDVPTFFDWQIKRKGKKAYILEDSKVINNFEFKNNLLYLLRKSGLVLLSLNVLTNQKYSDGKTEIVELWAYKTSLFWHLVVVDKMPCEELLEICTETVNGVRGMEPLPHIIYCGPDGKIFGWDLI